MAFDNKQISRRFIEEVWNTGNLALVDELVDPGYEGRDPVVGAYKRDALKQTIEGYRNAFPDLKLEIVHMVADDRFVATRWVAHGTHLGAFMGVEPTKKKTVVTGISLAEFRDGKIVAEFNEYDALGLMQQLGAAEKLTAEPPRTAVARPEKRA